MTVFSVMIYLWREARQQPLTVPLMLPLLSSTQFSCVLLQYGCHHRGLMGKLAGDRRKNVSLVVPHL